VHRPARYRRLPQFPSSGRVLLSLLLMLMLITRPMLVLACGVHEDSHPGVHAGHEQESPAPHADLLAAGDHGGFGDALDGVLHLGFCCGHFHVQAAQPLVLFVARPPAPSTPPQLWPTRVAGWSAPQLFRPPIAVS
jgi:hypothetical protein